MTIASYKITKRDYIYIKNEDKEEKRSEKHTKVQCIKSGENTKIHSRI